MNPTPDVEPVGAGRFNSHKHRDIHTISSLSIGQLRRDLDQSPLVDAHPHQTFVHALDQLLLANKHVVGAAAVVTEKPTQMEVRQMSGTQATA